jgi:hypothetical protein
VSRRLLFLECEKVIELLVDANVDVVDDVNRLHLDWIDLHMRAAGQ